MEQRRKIRVLIVDDEERFRTITAATLAKRGFEVTPVAGGGEAMDEVIRSDVDVVVLDVKMPGMNGNQALRAIKTLKPEVEVIMLTGHKTDDSESQAWEDETSAYLTKPCDIDRLAEEIRDVFAQRRQPLKLY